MTNTDDQQQTHLRKTRNRVLSPLMMRIMAVNVIALMILVGGVFYLNNFRSNLVTARVAEIEVQARIIAGALGESAAVGPESSEIDLAIARQIIGRLVGPTENRARLFAYDGRLLADSRFLAGDKKILEEKLDSESPAQSFFAIIEQTVFDFLDSFGETIVAEPDIDKLGLRGQDLDEVAQALVGSEKSVIRVREDGHYLVNIAVPVQRFRRVLGALLLSAETSEIERIVRAEEQLIIRVFLGALAVTILMSFFLSSTLVRPIRILAKAAERVRRGIGREESLPEFGDRRDEIGDLSRALSTMTRALYNQIDAVERFAADVAHELKNPITSMRSAIETMESTSKEEHRQQMLTILKEDVIRLERLISDVSDASRLDAELTRGHMEAVDLGLYLGMIVNGYNAIGLERGIKLEFEHPDHGVFLVRGIEGRLSQVWRNLIDNAISFSPVGGTIRVRLVKNTYYVTVAVEDEGPGLPEGAKTKIFKRFYSERPEGERFGSHSGLGLAISKQIIEAHGGRILGDSRKNKRGKILGARFEVSLPRINGRK